jgi:glycosyltransferase involved in cell wall biosynthesis
MKTLVSIVTPSYNQALYLEATLQSVFKQDYPFLEYLVVDGASTDGSQQIIQTYAHQLAWWVSEPDRGQAEAINKGFRKSRGEIVAWLNSDDLYLPGAVSQAVDLFESHPEVGLIFGDAVSADGQGTLLNNLRFTDQVLSDFLQFKMICQPAVFMRREALERVGYLDESYHFFLDHQLWIRFARETNLMHFPRYWAVSRYHPGAKNVTMASRIGDEVQRILEWAAVEPGLSEIYFRDEAKIKAGGHQITARYLLDGRKPRQAFLTYMKAGLSWPPAVREFWHRLIFAGLSSLGLGFLGKWYYSLKKKRRPEILNDSGLREWPGIHLD